MMQARTTLSSESACALLLRLGLPVALCLSMTSHFAASMQSFPAFPRQFVILDQISGPSAMLRTTVRMARAVSTTAEGSLSAFAFPSSLLFPLLGLRNRWRVSMVPSQILFSIAISLSVFLSSLSESLSYSLAILTLSSLVPLSFDRPDLSKGRSISPSRSMPSSRQKPVPSWDRSPPWPSFTSMVTRLARASITLLLLPPPSPTTSPSERAASRLTHVPLPWNADEARVDKALKAWGEDVESALRVEMELFSAPVGYLVEFSRQVAISTQRSTMPLVNCDGDIEAERDSWRPRMPSASGESMSGSVVALGISFRAANDSWKAGESGCDLPGDLLGLVSVLCRAPFTISSLSPTFSDSPPPTTSTISNINSIPAQAHSAGSVRVCVQRLRRTEWRLAGSGNEERNWRKRRDRPCRATL
mmetsp:Transcript_12986/g.23801  ORF Transcript_12986/g.23801 Transcript_12986/m.23801 type:complete len:418 (-) Transcript_12986:1044-2297(-)